MATSYTTGRVTINRFIKLRKFDHCLSCIYRTIKSIPFRVGNRKLEWIIFETINFSTKSQNILCMYSMCGT